MGILQGEERERESEKRWEGGKKGSYNIWSNKGWKSKIKTNIMKEVRGKTVYLEQKARSELHLTFPQKPWMQESWSIELKQYIKAKQQKHQTKILYPAKFFKSEEEFFSSKKIVGIMANTPDPQEMVKEALQKAKWYTWETQVCISKERVLEKGGINECKKM